MQQVQSPPTSGKCYPVFIGGGLEDGQSRGSLDPRSCDKLRCLNCDKRIVRYTNAKWRTSVDYLFVRNHNTNPKELVKVSEKDDKQGDTL